MINETNIIVNRTRYTNRLRGVLDIGAASVPLVVLGVIGTWLGLETALGVMAATLGYLLAIVVASGVLKLRGTGWREIGLARPQSWPSTVLLGVGAMVGALLVFIAVQVIAQVIALNVEGMEIAEPDLSRFNPLEGNLPLFILYVALAWTTVAFGEEMFYRAFLINRLSEVFQSTMMGWALALIGSSVIFGLAHYAEGLSGILSNGAFGLLFAWIYLRTERNLWVTIIAHGLLNTLRFVLVFAAAA
jgi:membrane protease YdiL (CAAX protease family)